MRIELVGDREPLWHRTFAATPTSHSLEYRETKSIRRKIEDFPGMTPDTPVVIYSVEHRGYWGPGRAGYYDLPGAGVYSFIEALTATNHCGPEKGICYQRVWVVEERQDQAMSDKPRLEKTGEPVTLWCHPDSCMPGIPSSALMRCGLDNLHQRLRHGTEVAIWSGEHGAYWRPDRADYGPLESAGVYSIEEAYHSTKHCSPEHKIAYQPVRRVRKPTDFEIRREWRSILEMNSRRSSLARRIARMDAEDLEKRGVTEEDIDRLFPPTSTQVWLRDNFVDPGDV